MILRTAFTLFLGVCFQIFSHAQGIEFFHGTWPEALEKAKTEKKLIFVDAFAAWCGPCKRMAANTFPDPKVGDFYNPNFICLKIDMEKSENQDFASKYPVGSYPTLMFLDSEGKIKLKDVGAKGPEQLIEMGKKALGTQDNSSSLEERYEKGERDPKFLLEYVTALNRFGKPSLKISNEYLNGQTDLTTEFNLKFILEAAVEADSRVFGLLIKNREAIEKLEDAAKVKSRIEFACKNTLKKAIEFKSEDLLKEAVQKMKDNYAEKAAQFEYEAETKFSVASKNGKRYLKAVKGYQKKEIKSNAALLHRLVQDMMRDFPDDKKVVGQAEKWAKTAAENGGLPEYYLTWAVSLKALGKKEDARKVAQKAKTVGGEKDPSIGQKVDWFIQSLD